MLILLLVSAWPATALCAADSPLCLFKNASVSNTDFRAAQYGRAPHALRVRSALLNAALFARDGADVPGEIVLNLFPDVIVRLQRRMWIRHSARRSAWIGEVRAGARTDYAVLVHDAGRLTGKAVIGGDCFYFYPLDDGRCGIAELDGPTASRDVHVHSMPGGADVVVDGTDEYGSDDARLFAPYVHSDGLTDYVPSQADSGDVVEVMVVYTPAAARASADIELDIQLALDEINYIYANSGVQHRLHLAHTAQVEYDETASASLDLSRLIDSGDGFMDEVHALRNEYAADLVSLWVAELDGASGIAWVMGAVSIFYENRAFSVVELAGALSDYSFAHELGHNMGAHHDRYSLGEHTTGAYSYAFGYVAAGQGWRTVMSYPDECDDLGLDCPRVPYYSSPEVSIAGVATGEPDSAHNALCLNNTAWTVANFRYSNSQLAAAFTVEPRQGTVDMVFTADAGGSYADGVMQVRWDWDGDGLWDIPYSSALLATHQYAAPGTYTVVLEMRQEDGRTAKALQQVVVENTPPTAGFSVNPDNGTVLTGFLVDAAASQDAEDAAADLRMRWDWETDGVWDSAYDTEKTARVQYQTPGNYTITLEVLDLNGATATATGQVVVANMPPEAAFTVTPDEGMPETVFYVDVAASSDTEDGAEVAVRWDWESDGVWDTPFSRAKTESHQYLSPGTYLITLQVQDSGGLTATAVRQVTVQEPPGCPVAALLGESVYLEKYARRFRDEILGRTMPGRACIRLYYKMLD